MSPIICARNERFGGDVSDAAPGRGLVVGLNADPEPYLPRDIRIAATLYGLERDSKIELVAGSDCAIPRSDRHQCRRSVFRRPHARTLRPPWSWHSQSGILSQARFASPSAAQAT
jgi:hypothetical protein